MHKIALLLRLLLALITVVIVAPALTMGCSSATTPETDPPPAECKLAPNGVACVAMDKDIYPLSAADCASMGTVSAPLSPYHCQQKPSGKTSHTCQEDPGRPGVMCCCDVENAFCTVKFDPPADHLHDECVPPPTGAVCVVLDRKAYATFETECASTRNGSIAYFCVDKPFEANCEQHPTAVGIWCCCDPVQDPYCEAHLAP